MDSLVLELKDLLQRETTEPPDDFFTRRLHERIAETRLSTPVPRWQTISISDLTVLEEHWTLGQLLTFLSGTTKPDHAEVICRSSSFAAGGIAA
jgi:hypothetical protein